jgi:hypothetical protein
MTQAWDTLNPFKGAELLTTSRKYGRPLPRPGRFRWLILRLRVVERQGGLAPLGFHDPYPGDSYDRAIFWMTWLAADTRHVSVRGMSVY